MENVKICISMEEYNELKYIENTYIYENKYIINTLLFSYLNHVTEYLTFDECVKKISKINENIITDTLEYNSKYEQIVLDTLAVNKKIKDISLINQLKKISLSQFLKIRKS